MGSADSERLLQNDRGVHVYLVEVLDAPIVALRSLRWFRYSI